MEAVALHAPAGPAPVRRSSRRTRARVIVYGSALVALAVAAASGMGERAFYFPSKRVSSVPLGAEEVWFESADGVRLHGWFFKARATDASSPAPSPTIVFAHGNAGSVIDHLSFADFLPDAGFNLLIFDYRGYGRSERASFTLRRAALTRDTRAAIEFVRARPDVDADRIGLFGYSLGAVIALAAAAQDDKVRALAIGGAFASWRGIAGDALPVVGPLFVRSGEDAVNNVTRLGERPLLVLHAANDEIIPLAHAERIAHAAKAAGVPVERCTAPIGGHNTVFDDDPGARRAVIEFFRRALR